MYQAKFLGKIVRITWQELRSLKERFNIENYKPTHAGSTYMINKRNCVLCSNHRPVEGSCGTCPLTVFEEPTRNHRCVGCMALMKTMLRRKSLGFFASPGHVYYTNYAEAARIVRVYAFLGRFKKV